MPVRCRGGYYKKKKKKRKNSTEDLCAKNQPQFCMSFGVNSSGQCSQDECWVAFCFG